MREIERKEPFLKKKKSFIHFLFFCIVSTSSTRSLDCVQKSCSAMCISRLTTFQKLAAVLPIVQLILCVRDCCCYRCYFDQSWLGINALEIEYMAQVQNESFNLNQRMLCTIYHLHTRSSPQEWCTMHRHTHTHRHAHTSNTKTTRAKSLSWKEKKKIKRKKLNDRVHTNDRAWSQLCSVRTVWIYFQP